MKTLVILIHPDLKNSIVNKSWIAALEQQPDQYTVHDLYRLYPDGKLDIAQEQRLLEHYDKIVFQFPLYWFNCPPLFKQWLDEVLTKGWAYGRDSGYKLRGKKMALAISAGINEADYNASGKYKYTLEHLTAPFDLTFNYIHADYRSFFAFYGAEYHATAERINISTSAYLEFLDKL